MKKYTIIIKDFQTEANIEEVKKFFEKRLFPIKLINPNRIEVIEDARKN